MYALVHDSQLLLGPIQYNYRMINSDLEDLEIEKRVSPRDYENVPIYFDELTCLVPAVQIIPEYDPRFASVGDFEWEIIRENDIPVRVEMTYFIVEKTLDQIKSEYKELVKPIRWNKENNQILTLTVNNTEVQISTSREERTQLVSKLSSYGNTQDITYNYKFMNDVWVEIGCTEIQYILQKIDEVVESAFNWEYTTLQTIDACTTGEEVYNVSLE